MISRAVAKRSVEALNRALAAGHAMDAGHGSKTSAFGIAAKALGINASTLRNRIASAKRNYGLEVDLTLYRQPEAVLTIEAAAKPRVRVFAGKPGEPEGPPRRVLAIGDLHDHPALPKDRGEWIGKLARDERVAKIISIGDAFTFDSLCHHIDNGTFNGRLKGTIQNDLASANEMLQAINAGLGDHQPPKHITVGNHEHRIYRFEDTSPEVFGILSAEFESVLTRNGWTFSPYGAWHFDGGVGFVHCPLNTIGQPYGGASRQPLLRDMVFDVVRGHDHEAYDHSAKKLGPLGNVRLIGLGCALPDGHIESYAEHCLTGWWWGVHILTLQGGRITDVQKLTMRTLQERYG